MLVVALGIFDQWSVGALRQLRADSGNLEARWNLAVVLLVCLATIVFGFLIAIAVGVLLSFALFIVAMNRSLVRSIGTGATRMSRRIYYPDQEKLLRERGDRIKFIELQGAVFFGTADRLALQVDALAKDARYVIIDVRRVTTVDASGSDGTRTHGASAARCRRHAAAFRNRCRRPARAGAGRVRRSRASRPAAVVCRRGPRAGTRRAWSARRCRHGLARHGAAARRPAAGPRSDDRAEGAAAADPGPRGTRCRRRAVPEG